MNVGTLIGDLKSKSILITGASGLICSAFIDQLMGDNERENLGIKIYAISRNKDYAQKRFQQYWNNPLFTFMQHDIIKPLSLDVPLDYIIHGASNASPKRYARDPVGTMKANLGAWRIRWIWPRRNKLAFCIFHLVKSMEKEMERILRKLIVAMWIV